MQDFRALLDLILLLEESGESDFREENRHAIVDEPTQNNI